MQCYKNLKGDSGVTHYELRPGSLALRFRNGDPYLYDRRQPGPHHVTRMQTLARIGPLLQTPSPVFPDPDQAVEVIVAHDGNWRAKNPHRFFPGTL